MIASNEFSIPELSDADPATSLHDLGAVELAHPTQDIDGDGTLDSVTMSGHDALIVATDTDADGFADHVTLVGDDGEFAAWDVQHTADGSTSWEETDHGRLGG